MKKSEFQQMIREAVAAEIKKQFRINLPIIVKEVVTDVLEEHLANGSRLPTLTENAKADWPDLKGKKSFTARDRGTIASMISGTDDVPSSATNILPKVVTDSGHEIELDPSQVPPSIVAAMNRDYSSFMAKMDKKKIG